MATKLVFIGDKRQQIYKWRGASDSFTLFQNRPNVKTLPMNISQRCSVAVCDDANSIFGENPIEAKYGAKAGSVAECDMDFMVANVKVNEFILCRTNAPLIKLCWKLIRAKLPARVLGRDIGYGLIALLNETIKDNKTEDINILAQAITVTTRTTVDMLNAADKQVAAEAALDRGECLLVFFEGCTTIEQIKEKINFVFTDEKCDVILLSTVHKIKGSEAETVYIINPEILQHPKGNPEEEKCIAFVAITRAKTNLFYVANVENKEKSFKAKLEKVLDDAEIEYEKDVLVSA